MVIDPATRTLANVLKVISAEGVRAEYEIEKLEGEKQELIKKVHEMNQQNEELKKENAELKKQLLPPNAPCQKGIAPKVSSESAE